MYSAIIMNYLPVIPRSVAFMQFERVTGMRFRGSRPVGITISEFGVKLFAARSPLIRSCLSHVAPFDRRDNYTDGSIINAESILPGVVVSS